MGLVDADRPSLVSGRGDTVLDDDDDAVTTMDARDVDWTCVAVCESEDEEDTDLVLYHRSLDDPRSIARREIVDGGESSTSSTFICPERVTCLDARPRGGGVVVGDANGYVRWCFLDASNGSSTTSTTSLRLDATGVTRVDAAGGFASTAARVFALDHATRTVTRRWSLPRLEPMVAAMGRRGVEDDDDVTLIAVGGAAVASCSATPRRGASSSASSASLFSAFRALGSTALGVVKTAFVDASAPLHEDAVVYEGEDLDDVSSLRLETATWNAAFVDAPRRFLLFASAPPPFDFFAVSDVAHRVSLFRLIGKKSLRLTAVVKGCRDASFCFHPRSGLLALHRPSVRRLETRDPRDGTVLDAVDATDVVRLIRGVHSIVVVVSSRADTDADAAPVRFRRLEDFF